MGDDHETWLIETGADILTVRQERDLRPLERLVYCLWVADYGMRNAGDLETAKDLDPNFHKDGKKIARILDLPVTLKAFSMSRRKLQKTYFDLFDGVCAEIRAAYTVSL